MAKKNNNMYKKFIKKPMLLMQVKVNKISSILAPQTSSLKWTVNSCLAGSQNLKYLGISDVWLTGVDETLAEWTLSGFLMTVAKTL